MNEIATIGLDIAKHVFQVHGADDRSGRTGLSGPERPRSKDLKKPQQDRRSNPPCPIDDRFLTARYRHLHGPSPAALTKGSGQVEGWRSREIEPRMRNARSAHAGAAVHVSGR